MKISCDSWLKCINFGRLCNKETSVISRMINFETPLVKWQIFHYSIRTSPENRHGSHRKNHMVGRENKSLMKYFGHSIHSFITHSVSGLDSDLDTLNSPSQNSAGTKIGEHRVNYMYNIYLRREATVCVYIFSVTYVFMRDGQPCSRTCTTVSHDHAHYFINPGAPCTHTHTSPNTLYRSYSTEKHWV